MHKNEWSRWGVALLLTGCSSKLEVVPGGSTGDSTGGAGSAVGDAGVWHGGEGGVLHAGGGGAGGAGAAAGRSGSPDAGSDDGGAPPVELGALGENCIPKAIVHQGAGTVGEADVIQPAHCNDGLTCNAEGQCVIIPDCPQNSGVCVVSRSSADAVSAGGAGAGEVPIGVGAVLTPAMSTGDRVRYLTADGSNVYWVDHGTFDANDNYNHDGALMAYDGHSVHALASALEGPVDVHVTNAHAYVSTDGAPPSRNSTPGQWLRIPLTGGAAQAIAGSEGLNGTPGDFVNIGDRAFYRTDDLFQVSPAADATISVFEATSHLNYDGRLTADAEYIYFTDRIASQDGGLDPTLLERAPLIGGAPQQLASMLADPSADRFKFEAHGDFIYALTQTISSDRGDAGAAVTLDRVPKSGGSWERVRPLGIDSPIEFHVVGDQFIWAAYPTFVVDGERGDDETRVEIYAASFISDAPPVLVTVIPIAGPFLGGPRPTPFWAATSTAVYWTPDARTIYARQLSDLL